MSRLDHMLVGRLPMVGGNDAGSSSTEGWCRSLLGSRYRCKLMIIQMMKRWLHKLWAWWRTDAHATEIQALGKHHQVSDLTGRAGEDGTVPQLSPVAVERDADRSTGSVETTRSPEISPERSLTTCSIVMPSAQQRLEFLRYLVQRGSLNEGFEKEEVPEQYRSDTLRKK